MNTQSVTSDQVQLYRGQVLTETLIRECEFAEARGDLVAATIAKALVAAAVPFGLRSAGRDHLCAWLRGVAAELEKNAERKEIAH